MGTKKANRSANRNITIARRERNTGVLFSEEALSKISDGEEIKYIKLSFKGGRMYFARGLKTSLTEFKIIANHINGKIAGRRTIRIPYCELPYGDYNLQQFDEDEGLYFIDENDRI